MAVQIITDSTSYIKKEIKDELGINIVSLNVTFNNDSFKETDLNNEDFYEMMAKRGIPTSSQPSVGEMYNLMENIVENGDSLICIFISSDMSGTYSTACMVKEMVLEKYKDAKIEIIDSRSNCMQLGSAAITAARAAKEGKSFEEIKNATEENIKRSRFLFIPDNLEYLRKGGRIGGAAALLGDIFKIIPILTVKDGKTSVVTKIRTKKKAILAMVDTMLKDVEKFGLKEVVVHHINCFNEAKELADLIKEKINISIDICDIGPVIGLHVGPGAIGIVYCTEKQLI